MRIKLTRTRSVILKRLGVPLELDNKMSPIRVEREYTPVLPTIYGPRVVPEYFLVVDGASDEEVDALHRRALDVCTTPQQERSIDDMFRKVKEARHAR